MVIHLKAGQRQPKRDFMQISVGGVTMIKVTRILLFSCNTLFKGMATTKPVAWFKLEGT
ncbi:Hypothetical protein I595_380 [Croceitalea dokdonensis DOKDO 023]|uniref:Uncharacterized protein n=1 Tax=Croceitalea dokdonensis DOKDO 023 TaxID=1300341 RepID=A0A0P7ANH1_9FLAO|nr:Hypothetical protein I595_380 [Croceitalea dokdonensis DOKDO 023]